MAWTITATAKSTKAALANPVRSKSAIMARLEHRASANVNLVHKNAAMSACGSHVRGKYYPRRRSATTKTTIAMDRSMIKYHLALVIQDHPIHQASVSVELVFKIVFLDLGVTV
jgi:hypothetical protein